MECLKPQTVKDVANPVPCGWCYACFTNRRNAWSFRLKQELKGAKSAQFITLTYNSKNLPITMIGGKYKMTLYKPDPINFMKRFRKLHPPKTIKYYAVGEYGSEGDRPHYHYIMYNAELEPLKNIEKIWGKGQVHIGEVNDKTIHYVTGYLINRKYIPKNDIQREFALISKGLGKRYVEKTKQYHKNGQIGYIRTEVGKQALPRYYSEKIFTTEEKRIQSEQMAEISLQKRREAYSKLLKSGVNPIIYDKEQKNFIEKSKQKLITKNKKNRLL